MTDRIDRIRTHLEPHGYEVWPADTEAGAHRYDNPNSEEDFGGIEDTEDGAWLRCLNHFLADTSKTGARQEDLINHGPGKEIGPVQIYGTGYFDSEDPSNEDKHWRGYCTYPSDGPAPSPTGDAKTVDASVADCWRRVFIDQEQP